MVLICKHETFYNESFTVCLKSIWNIYVDWSSSLYKCVKLKSKLSQLLNIHVVIRILPYYEKNRYTLESILKLNSRYKFTCHANKNGIRFSLHTCTTCNQNKTKQPY